MFVFCSRILHDDLYEISKNLTILDPLGTLRHSEKFKMYS